MAGLKEEQMKLNHENRFLDIDILDVLKCIAMLESHLKNVTRLNQARGVNVTVNGNGNGNVCGVSTPHVCMSPASSQSKSPAVQSRVLGAVADNGVVADRQREHRQTAASTNSEFVDRGVGARRNSWPSTDHQMLLSDLSNLISSDVDLFADWKETEELKKQMKEEREKGAGGGLGGEKEEDYDRMMSSLYNISPSTTTQRVKKEREKTQELGKMLGGENSSAMKLIMSAEELASDRGEVSGSGSARESGSARARRNSK